MHLTDYELAVLSGATGGEGDRLAMELVAEAGRALGAERLIKISSAHIDGCLFHGASGVLYCETLAKAGARVKCPTTTNVGALNLLNPAQSRLSGQNRKLAYRLMVAHEHMGCRPSWTCAPYQAGSRPELGEQVAWGESNAVAFVNTVLGARTNRYGDFLDICCAITGRAPLYGLHQPENRSAEIVMDVSNLEPSLQSSDVFFPVLGALIGRLAGARVCAVDGLKAHPDEDQMKALCAASASSGAVALIHIVGVTPEAPDLQTALGGCDPEERILIKPDMLQNTLAALSGSVGDQLDLVALGSPHFSIDECRALLRLAAGTKFKLPVYVCTGRHTMALMEDDGTRRDLEELGVTFVVDTCVVVTPILPDKTGVMMTNSAKFAHYATGNTRYAPVFGSLRDCVLSAQYGKLICETGKAFQ